MAQPPSFQPKKHHPRPSAYGAQEVGRSAASHASSLAPQQQASTRKRASSIPSMPPSIPPRRNSGGAPSPRTPPPQSVPPRASASRRSAAQGSATQGSAPRYSTQPPRSTRRSSEPGVQRSIRPGIQQPRQKLTSNDASYPQRTAAYSQPAALRPQGNTPYSPSGSYATQRTTSQAASGTYKARSWGKILLAIVLIWLFITASWFVYLYIYGNSKLAHVPALAGASNTPGTTYLIVGSDERGGIVNDSTEGMRADSIMLLHKPRSGNPVLLSIPRDSYVEIPGYNANKINASYAFGGPELLTSTVENLTGLTIDHYVQIGMDGVADLTDAVGGVNLCLDYDVNDELSGLVWQAGCHDADGATALAFSRMRYADPLGDIGRTERQRQVVSKILGKAISLHTVTSPSAQRELVGAGASALTVDDSDSLLSLVGAGFTLRSVMGDGGLVGTPPISDLAYYPGGVGATVRLDPEKIDSFWAKVRDGSISAADFGQ